MINPNISKEPKMIFSMFKDYGPEILFNNSTIDEAKALTLVMSGMTLVEMNQDAKGRVDGSKNPKMLGPIPVPEMENLKAIAIPFETEITSSTDERIQEAGYRLCVAYLIFEGSAVREVLDSYGLIEPYFAMVARGLNKEDKINAVSIKKVLTKMVDMLQGNIPRIFTVNPDGTMKELIGKKIEYADIYFICDFIKNKMNILFYNPSLDIWRRREIYKIASEFNSSRFRSALRIITIDEVKEMGDLLDLLNIEIAPV